ncbi:MAG: phage tail protein [Bacteroidota bacterium]|nr:phage tail protein [Bacteroidota bacterium]
MGSHPLPKYHFRVDWGGTQLSFSEVSGLSMEFAVVEHRDGSSPDQHAIKMPGLKKYSNIILKRAVRKADQEFFKWINSVHLNTVPRRNIVISLLNEAHEPVISWKVLNAWPCKYTVADLQATSNEVLMETLELTHEGFEVSV